MSDELKAEIREGSVTHGEKILDPKQRFSNLLKYWLPRWVFFEHENWATIRFEFRGKNLCLTNRPKLNVPAMVIGSGPTLEESLPWLKHWKYPIFCSSSNAKVLLKYGRQPDFICAYDSNPKYPVQQLGGINWKGSTLVTHPCVAPNVLQLWRWDKAYYRMLQPGINFFDEILLMAYPYIKVGFLNSGSTANNALEIANFLGCNPIILVGVDCAYPKNLSRVTGWDLVKFGKNDRKWVATPPGKVPKDATHYNNRLLHKTENGLFTNEEMIDYKIGAFVIVRLDRFQPIVCTGETGIEGAITEFPLLSIKKIIEAQETKSGFKTWMWDKEKLIEVTEDYLAKHNIKKRITDDGKVVIGFDGNETKDKYMTMEGEIIDESKEKENVVRNSPVDSEKDVKGGEKSEEGKVS